MTAPPKPRFLDRSTPPRLVTLILVAGISALSMNIFLPSLPGMATYFETDYAVIQLAVSAYLGMTGLVQLLIGPFADRYGRRPVLVVSFVIFILATIGCLLAPTIELFLVCRMIQAIIASAMVLARAIVRDMVPTEQAASMIGYVTMGMALVPMVGPFVGGVLNDLFGWQANFGMLLAGAMLIFAILWLDLGETNPNDSSNFLEQIRDYPELFSSHRFWGYALTAAFASGSFFALLGGGPFVATYVFDLSASALGLYFGIVSLGYITGNFLSGRFSVRLGINRMLLFGGLSTTAGLTLSLLLFLLGVTHPLAFFGFTFFVGFGNGMTLPNANAGMLSVRPKLAGTASGLGGALMTGGGALISAIAGAVVAPDLGPFPLLGMMLAASIASVVTAFYVIRVEHRRGPLGVEFL